MQTSNLSHLEFRQDKWFWMNTLIWMCSGTMHDGMIIFEIGTLSYMEVQAVAVACSALLPLAGEAWGVVWIRTTSKNQKRVNKCQSDSRNGVGRLT